MCGRIVQRTALGAVCRDLGMEPWEEEFRPRYNIPPGGRIWSIRAGEDGKLELVRLRWGLIPSWAKDEKIGFSMSNARAETITEKAAFKNAVKKRRCVIPIDGFYEWQKVGKEKLPYLIRFEDDRTFFIAGIWERWTSETGEVIESCAAITTSANDLISTIHERMPVIISKENIGAWLDSDVQDGAALREFFVPYSAEGMTMVRVSTRVNTPKNDDPECLAAA